MRLENGNNDVHGHRDKNGIEEKRYNAV